MPTLESLTAAFAKLPRALTDEVANVVSQNRHVLEDANTAQLAEGLRADGRDIVPEYAPLTKALKQIKGQPYDKVTLRDEGDFYTGIQAQLDGRTAVQLVGTDKKTSELEEKYGEEILGLSDQSITEFQDDILRPELLDFTRNYLGV